MVSNDCSCLHANNLGAVHGLVSHNNIHKVNAHVQDVHKILLNAEKIKYRKCVDRLLIVQRQLSTQPVVLKRRFSKATFLFKTDLLNIRYTGVTNKNVWTHFRDFWVYA